MIKRLLICFLASFSAANYAQVANDASKVIEIKAKQEITVYRSPTCGCCSKWVKQLQASDFKVIDHVTKDVQSIKDKYGVNKSLASCHTAIVNGYVVEGHVPVADINSMLQSRPSIKGLSVPGMVVGSPGMEMGARKDPFKVISFDKNSKLNVYKAYEKY